MSPPSILQEGRTKEGAVSWRWGQAMLPRSGPPESMYHAEEWERPLLRGCSMGVDMGWWSTENSKGQGRGKTGREQARTLTWATSLASNKCFHVCDHPETHCPCCRRKTLEEAGFAEHRSIALGICGVCFLAPIPGHQTVLNPSLGNGANGPLLCVGWMWPSWQDMFTRPWRRGVGCFLGL